MTRFYTFFVTFCLEIDWLISSLQIAFIIVSKLVSWAALVVLVILVCHIPSHRSSGAACPPNLLVFNSSPFNRKPLLAKAGPTVSLALIVTTTMFLFTYLPQAALMTFTSGPIAALSAGLLVLSESSTLTTTLSKIFLVQDALTDTFDGTLLSKHGTQDLVGQGRQVKASGSDPISKLGKMLKRPFALIRYLMFLPLNAIPFVGTVIFVILQGRKAGPGAHDRYFQLKGWSSEQRRRHIEEFSGAYTRYVGSVLSPP